MIEQIKAALDSYMIGSPENNRGFELRMSMAGDCILKMDRDAQFGKKVPDVEGVLRMGLGEPVHAMWREIFAKVYPKDFEFAEEEVRLTFELDGETVTIPGHPDGSLRFLDAIVEVKGTSDSTFALVKNAMRPLGAHIEQANVYAHVHSKSQVLFLYQNRDSGEYLLLLEPFNKTLLESTILKWSTVIRNKKKGILSPRPYQDATASPCWFCGWKADCYKDYAETVAKMGAAEPKDPEILAHVSNYAAVRRAKLDNEKAEDKVKTDIALWLIDNKFNTIKTPEGLITLKIGKANNPLVSIKPTKEV